MITRFLLTLILLCGLQARVDADIHGALGFTSGAVVGALTGKDALMQATSGALGAVVAETLNDIHQAEIEAGVNTGLNDQQFNTFLHKLQEHHQFHTLVGGLTALGFGLDPTQAMVSAQVAQESNNLLAAAYAAAVGGVVVYNLAHKANLLYEGEFEEFLTEVGIEIALVRATAGLGNIAKAASKTTTGQQLLAAAKPYVYKVIIQGKAFIVSSTDQVLQLIAKQQPQLATVLNKQASSFNQFLQADVKAGVKVGKGVGVKGVRKVDTIKASPEQTLVLKQKPGMHAQDFDRKVRALDDLAKRGKLFKKQAPRDPKVVASYRARLRMRAQKEWQQSDPERYMRFEERLSKMDADHLHELQLGGRDIPSELGLLDISVNRSVGPQIRHQLKNMPDGTRITRVIKE